MAFLKTIKEAANWYWFAADQGIPSAQAKLGMMYEYGHGVFQDYVSAYMWYSLGALQGHKIAREHRDILKKKTSPSQIEVAQQLAREWLAKHRDISMFYRKGGHRPPGINSCPVAGVTISISD